VFVERLSSANPVATNANPFTNKPTYGNTTANTTADTAANITANPDANRGMSISYSAGGVCKVL